MEMDFTQMTQDEWLEADGLGGFASGTIAGIRTRRYHALLLAATQPPGGRMVLVNGVDASVETATGTFALSSQRYPSGIVHPDGANRIAEFVNEPWPRWTFALGDGIRVEQEIFTVHGAAVTIVSWRLLDPTAKANLLVRAFFSGRDYHALHHENGAFNLHPQMDEGRLTWRPYPDIPSVTVLHNGDYQHQPDWYRNFVYTEEQARGLDDREDLAAPGFFRFALATQRAILIFAAEQSRAIIPAGRSAADLFDQFYQDERRRRSQWRPLERAADQYIVQRGKGKTIVAGYPWFTDWGRDTFIALRGLCIATGRLDDAREILLEWSNVVSQGMLPNLFPDRGGQPEYNTVDASLWYIIAVHDFLAATKTANGIVSQWQRKTLQKAVHQILSGYAQGTRFGIRMDSDGLLAAGIPGVQLTWMDAKVGDWVVTPRIGKPVEVQALWLNALWIGSQSETSWAAAFEQGLASFRSRFWDAERNCLYDVIDTDHVAGKLDATLRPNQIFAVGGLPLALFEAEQARLIVTMVEQHLWTPMGLRSLAPGQPGYTPRYQGGVLERDGAYHQGTIWPWLAGAFIEAWVRAQGNTEDAKLVARERYLKPLLEHLGHAGLGHVSEIADADSPHTARGCPFQAWSLGELLRLDRQVLASVPPTTS